MTTRDLAEWLRAQPSLLGSPPPLDLTALPADPHELFIEWLTIAVEAGVPEPHAGTLATVDADGRPDARTLILKDVGTDGWAFAGPRSSAKGAQLAVNPTAALDFWWQPLVRTVRIRGPVREATREESAADLAARSASARAGVAADDWVLWRLDADHLEFWQGAQDRRHIRIAYDRTPTDGAGASWTRSLIGAGT